VLSAGLALGCATPDPILYPNETLRANGDDQVDADLAECDELAKKYEADPSRAGEVAERTARDAAVGGAVGAAGGAVLGDAGRGAAAGAAAGAAGGLIHSVFRTHRRPDPVYAAFVERCLRENGYEVIGWR
jgi:hypothetical protein